MKTRKFNFTMLCLILFIQAASIWAQTTVFTYQGKLTDTGTPQSIYEMRFRLYGSTGGSDQIGATITNPNVSVNQGVFTVQLDFGAAAFPGADRFLQISVRRSSSESFVTLNPRQQITSSPYSIRTLSAAQADVALDANKLGGVDASEYVTTSSVGNSFIKNSTTQQTANFNISGNGVVGGTLGVGMNPGGFKFSVNGPAQFRPRGNDDNAIRFLSDLGNIPTISLSKSDGSQAEMRLEGTSLRLVTGFGFGTPNNGITVDGSGNVGIGTSSPTAKLSVAGAGAFSAVGAARFDLFNTTAGSGYLQNVTDGGLFQIATTGGATRLVINNTGNIGIGTTTPQAKFHVNGSSWFQGDSTPLPAAAGKGIVVGFGGEQGYIQAFDYGAFTGKNLLINNSGGNVGIGTATPQAKLQVAGNVAQDINSNGLVKAMIVIQGNVAGNPNILRCYNGIINSSTGNCGFTVTRPLDGVIRINFNFPVAARFVLITPEYNSIGSFAGERNIGANYRPFNNTTIEIFTFKSGDSENTVDATFTLILF